MRLCSNPGLADNWQRCQSIPTGVGPGGVPPSPVSTAPSSLQDNSANPLSPQYDYLSWHPGGPQQWPGFISRSWWLSFRHSRIWRVSASQSWSSASSWASSLSPSSWWRRPTRAPGWRGSGSPCRTLPQTSSQPTPSTPPGYQVRQTALFGPKYSKLFRNWTRDKADIRSGRE